MDDFNRVRLIFTTQDLKKFVNTSLTNYFDLFDNTDEFENYNGDNSIAEFFEIRMDLNHQYHGSTTILKNDTKDNQGNYVFPSDNPILGKNNSELREWIRDVKEFQIRYKNIKIEYPVDSQMDVSCYNWTVNQRFYHTESPQVRVELDFTPDTCSNVVNLSSFTWLNLITIFIASISFIIELLYILETVRTVGILRTKFTRKDKDKKQKSDQDQLFVVENDTNFDNEESRSLRPDHLS